MNYRLIFLSVILVLCLGCGSNTTLSGNTNELAYFPLVDVQYSDISITQNGDELNLRVSSLSPDGCFIHIPLGLEQHIASQQWSENADLLTLAVSIDDGIDVGIMPLPGFAGGVVEAAFSLTSEQARTTSIPPYLSDNQILQEVFEITEIDEEQVLLEWPQVNVGDYDFNGEVGVADLVPIAINYLKNYDVNSEDAPDLPEFWVDGDRNGEINGADIVPIAQHYASVVDGYKVEQNGVSLEKGSPDNPTVIRDRETRYELSLPPLYQVVVEGSADDTWDVIPVDTDGQPGTSLLDVVDEAASIKVGISFTGFECIGLNSNSSLTGNGCSLLRIIEDIEIVNGAEYGGGFYDEDSSSFFFYGIPRDELVYLEVMYYPDIDPSTGVARTGPPGGEGAAVPESAMTRTVVPFILPERTSLQKIDVSISFKENTENGGYYILTQTQYDPQQTFLEGFLHYGAATYFVDTAKPRISRLDVRNGEVAWDQTLLGEYNFAPTLSDINRDGISPAYAQQLKDYLTYSGNIEIGSVTGYIGSFDEANGKLTIRTPIAVTAYDEYTLIDTEVYFSESAIFNEQEIVGESLRDNRFDPSTLAANDEVVLEVDFLGGVPQDWDKIWIRKLTRIVPEETTDEGS